METFQPLTSQTSAWIEWNLNNSNSLKTVQIKVRLFSWATLALNTPSAEKQTISYWRCYKQAKPNVCPGTVRQKEEIYLNKWRNSGSGAPRFHLFRGHVTENMCEPTTTAKVGIVASTGKQKHLAWIYINSLICLIKKVFKPPWHWGCWLTKKWTRLARRDFVTTNVCCMKHGMTLKMPILIFMIWWKYVAVSIPINDFSKIFLF